jgi:hypothetical protein
MRLAERLESVAFNEKVVDLRCYPPPWDEATRRKALNFSILGLVSMAFQLDFWLVSL